MYLHVFLFTLSLNEIPVHLCNNYLQTMLLQLLNSLIGEGEKGERSHFLVSTCLQQLELVPEWRQEAPSKSPMWGAGTPLLDRLSLGASQVAHGRKLESLVEPGLGTSHSITGCEYLNWNHVLNLISAFLILSLHKIKAGCKVCFS